MSVLDQILPLFLARMIGGYAICLGIFGLYVREGSWRRVSLFTIAGLCAVAAYWEAPLVPILTTGITALILERAITFGEQRSWRAIAIMVPLGLWSLLSQEMPPNIATFPGAIAVGGSLGAMLLGHSYLTVRNLSFKPFQRFTMLLLIVLVVRLISVSPILFLNNLEMMDWVYLSARAAFGLFLPLVFAWMAWQCARIESNQSATGILYAMTALVFLGEMTAVFLQVTLKVAA